MKNDNKRCKYCTNFLIQTTLKSNKTESKLFYTKHVSSVVVNTKVKMDHAVFGIFCSDIRLFFDDNFLVFTIFHIGFGR